MGGQNIRVFGKRQGRGQPRKQRGKGVGVLGGKGSSRANIHGVQKEELEGGGSAYTIEGGAIIRDHVRTTSNPQRTRL